MHSPNRSSILDDENSPLLGSMEVSSIQFSNVEKPKGSSWFVVAIIIINATLGAGLLDFPAAFNSAGGIAVSMIVHIILALLATVSFILLCWCADLRGCVTYQETVGALCGVWIKRICSIMMIVYAYGSCVAYIVVVGDQTDRVLQDRHYDVCNTWYVNRKFLVSVTSIFVILPFCYAKKIDFLKYASGLATLGVFYFVFLTVFQYYHRGQASDVKTKPDVWTDIFRVVPTICFAYQSHLSIIPTYACMETRNLRDLSFSTAVAMVITFTVYSMVGIFGYLTYGSKVDPDILSSFNVDNGWVAVGFFMFAVKTFLTYPVLEYVGREALESLWVEVFRLDPLAIILGEKRRRICFASFWFVTSLLLGILLPNILTVIRILGGLAALFIFIFPGICLLSAVFMLEDIMTENLRRIARWTSYVYIVVGAFLFGLTMTQGVETLFLPSESKNPCS